MKLQNYTPVTDKQIREYRAKRTIRTIVLLIVLFLACALAWLWLFPLDWTWRWIA